MKITGFILLATILLSSCKDVAEDILELFPEMSATVDGSEWKSLTRKTVSKDGKFIISGVSATGKAIAITIQGTTVGNYDVPLEAVAFYNDTDLDDLESPTNAFIGLSGTVNLTEVNTSKKTLSGTFSFKATKLVSSVDVTNGKFKDIKYTEE